VRNEHEFIAKTTVTQCCSDRCAKRLYKKRKRSELLQEAIEVHRKQTIQSIKNEQSKRIMQHETAGTIHDERRLLNTVQMAFVLGISKRSLQRLLVDKNLPRLTIGKRILFQKQDVLSYLTTKRSKK
jgi:excisionase family DNA binding protein